MVLRQLKWRHSGSLGHDERRRTAPRGEHESLSHLQLHRDALSSSDINLCCSEPFFILDKLHQMHKEDIRNPKASAEKPRRSRGMILEFRCLQHPPPCRLTVLPARVHTSRAFLGWQIFLARVRKLIIILIVVHHRNCGQMETPFPQQR